MRGSWVERGTVVIRLGRPHFAFFRGYLDGLEIGALMLRYLGDDARADDHTARGDLRRAKSMVKWIRAQLLLAARRSLAPADARLLAISPGVLTPTRPGLSSLEAYREDHDPDGMYGEAELILLFQEAGAGGTAADHRRALRNQRLHVRQQRALQQLEALVSADPAPLDPVDAWLDPMLAARLVAVNVRTLADLVALIDRHGYRWYTKVPKIGLTAALHIGRWLQADTTRQALGHRLTPGAFTPRRALTSLPSPVPTAGEIATLERLRLPAGLDGADGTNRGARCQLDADEDLSALLAWLSSRQASAHTLRSYRKECERFLIWAVFERGKPLSSLGVEDCAGYRRFLGLLGRTPPANWAPQFRLPQAAWICARGVTRDSRYWRPFQGSLSPASQRQALIIIQALLQWLVDQDYLYANPMRAQRMPAPGVSGLDTSRALTVAEWQVVQAYVGQQEMNADDAYWRLRCILALAYGTGLRISELAELRRRHLQPFLRAGDTRTSWMLNVTGKGNRVRDVGVGPEVLRELLRHLACRGYPDIDSLPPDAPLIGPLGGQEPADTLSVQRIDRIIKRFFAGAARFAAEAEPALARRLESVSTHWLRHTFASHALANGMPLDVLRDLLGHRSLDTTSIYITTERDRRSRAMDAFTNAGVLSAAAESAQSSG